MTRSKVRLFCGNSLRRVNLKAGLEVTDVVNFILPPNCNCKTNPGYGVVSKCRVDHFFLGSPSFYRARDYVSNPQSLVDVQVRVSSS